MSTSVSSTAIAYATEIREGIAAAQGAGVLDPKWNIIVHVVTGDDFVEIAVTVANVKNHMKLFVEDERGIGRRWSDEANELMVQVRKYMESTEAWEDGHNTFLFLNFAGFTTY